jgi:hypothetical protein
MDPNKVKARREKLVNKLNRNSSTWKPKPGKNYVRILPKASDPDYPFEELHTHWSIGKRSFLCLQKNEASPEPECPICNMASELWNSDDTDEKDLAKKLFAGLRFYAPVLVRGEEEAGPKWWAFSNTTYDELTSDIDDSGDYTDIEAGRDVIVTYLTPKEANNKYGKTSVKLSLKQTPLSDDPDVVEKALNEQKDIHELFPFTAYADMRKALKDWLIPEDADDEDADEQPASTPDEPDEAEESTDESAGVNKDVKKKFANLLD